MGPAMPAITPSSTSHRAEHVPHNICRPTHPRPHRNLAPPHLSTAAQRCAAQPPPHAHATLLRRAMALSGPNGEASCHSTLVQPRPVPVQPEKEGRDRR